MLTESKITDKTNRNILFKHRIGIETAGREQTLSDTKLADSYSGIMYLKYTVAILEPSVHDPQT